MSDEGAVPADLGVEPRQHVAVPVHVEVRYPPDTFAQDVHDRADVEELHAAARGPQVHDVQARLPGGGRLTILMAGKLLARLRTEEALDEFEGGRRTDMLREVRAVLRQYPGNLTPVRCDRMAAALSVEPSRDCALSDAGSSSARIRDACFIGLPPCGADSICNPSRVTADAVDCGG